MRWLSFALVISVFVLGAAEWIYPDAFWCTSRFDRGWYWLQDGSGYARWEFLSLPRSEQIPLEVLVCAMADGELPPELAVKLSFAPVGSGIWTPFLLKLSRLQVGKNEAVYFGQLTLSRRSFNLGSALSVRAETAIKESLGFGRHQGLQLGFRRDSLRLWDGGVFNPGPFQEVWVSILPASVTPRDDARPPSPLVKLLCETETMEDAHFLSPGRYRGELGWPGPGKPMDSRDWYRLNLQPGQMLRLSLTVSGNEECYLGLYNPRGGRVGEIRGNFVELSYLADEPGGWYVRISCLRATGIIHYELSVSIYSEARQS